MSLANDLLEQVGTTASIDEAQISKIFKKLLAADTAVNNALTDLTRLSDDDIKDRKKSISALEKARELILSIDIRK